MNTLFDSSAATKRLWAFWPERGTRCPVRISAQGGGESHDKNLEQMPRWKTKKSFKTF